MTKLEFIDKINDILVGLNTLESDLLGSLYDELMRSQWIPVEERLPAIAFDTGSTWDCSDEVCIYLATGSHCVGRYEHDKNTNEFYWVLYGVDKDIPVTHWMPLPVPPRKEV